MNEAFCKNLGAVEYVKKPIDFERLKEILKTILTTKVRKRWTEVESTMCLAQGEARRGDEPLNDELLARQLEENAIEIFLAGGAELLLGSACQP